MEKNVDNRAGGLRGKAVKIRGEILTSRWQAGVHVFHTPCGWRFHTINATPDQLQGQQECCG
jgi:hypothetical protein